ncbi:MAG: holo-ACP synthase [Gammaproteobacteria bacterium]
MILGLGTDLVDIRRIAQCYERFGTRFVSRILSPGEQSAFANRMHDPEIYLASRFAAKEAVAKALGQGFRGGLSMRDLIILTNELGQPYVEYEGIALNLIQQKKVTSTHLSISHERHYAMAVVVLGS